MTIKIPSANTFNVLGIRRLYIIDNKLNYKLFQMSYKIYTYYKLYI